MTGLLIEVFAKQSNVYPSLYHKHSQWDTGETNTSHSGEWSNAQYIYSSTTYYYAVLQCVDRWQLARLKHSAVCQHMQARTYTARLLPYSRTCPKAGPRGGDGDAFPAGMYIRKCPIALAPRLAAILSVNLYNKHRNCYFIMLMLHKS